MKRVLFIVIIILIILLVLYLKSKMSGYDTQTKDISVSNDSKTVVYMYVGKTPPTKLSQFDKVTNKTKYKLKKGEKLYVFNFTKNGTKIVRNHHDISYDEVKDKSTITINKPSKDRTTFDTKVLSPVQLINETTQPLLYDINGANPKPFEKGTTKTIDVCDTCNINVYYDIETMKKAEPLKPGQDADMYNKFAMGFSKTKLTIQSKNIGGSRKIEIITPESNVMGLDFRPAVERSGTTRKGLTTSTLLYIKNETRGAPIVIETNGAVTKLSDGGVGTVNVCDTCSVKISLDMEFIKGVVSKTTDETTKRTATALMSVKSLTVPSKTINAYSAPRRMDVKLNMTKTEISLGYELKTVQPTSAPTSAPTNKGPTSAPIQYYSDEGYWYTGDIVTKFPNTTTLDACLVKIKDYYDKNPKEASATNKYFEIDKASSTCLLRKNKGTGTKQAGAQTWSITSPTSGPTSAPTTSAQTSAPTTSGPTSATSIDILVRVKNSTGGKLTNFTDGTTTVLEETAQEWITNMCSNCNLNITDTAGKKLQISYAAIRNAVGGNKGQREVVNIEINPGLAYVITPYISLGNRQTAIDSLFGQLVKDKKTTSPPIKYGLFGLRM